jgi:meiotic recombination protein REC8
LDQDIAFHDAPPFVFEDDELPLAEPPPFSPARRLSPTSGEQVPHSSSGRPEEEVSSSAEAPQRKTRAPKVLQPDYPQELANSDLSQWNTNYLANMAEATRIKQQHKAVALAKKNAAFWVLGQGIAGVGMGSGDARVPSPLEVLSGQALLAALTGRESSPAGTKRTRSLSDGLDEGRVARRVRARGDEEQQVGRVDAGGNDVEGLLLGDDDGIVFPGGDMVRMVLFLVVIC